MATRRADAASVLKLIQAAVGQQVPVLGHCLGGQLMAKALGGTVTRNPVDWDARNGCFVDLPDSGERVKDISIGNMLDGLFAITRDFDMAVQPHLLLLQK